MAEIVGIKEYELLCFKGSRANDPGNFSPGQDRAPPKRSVFGPSDEPG